MDSKLEEVRLIVLEWANKQGHDSCWYYPELFSKLIEVLNLKVKNPNLPSLLEFKQGCYRYQVELYGLKTNDC